MPAGRTCFKDSTVHLNGSGSELVVVLHGWGVPRDGLRDLFETVRQERPNADIFAPVYAAGWVSRIDPLSHPDRYKRFNERSDLYRSVTKPLRTTWMWTRRFICWLSSIRARDIAAELSDQIQERFEERARRNDKEVYKEIILVGHSIGALIVRKAYVFAKGMVSDHKDPDLKSKTWADRVSRIILLSCMNRGWRLQKRPQHMARIVYSFLRLLSAPARLLGRGKLIFDLEWGSPMVANLRLQWMKLPHEQPTQPGVGKELLAATASSLTQKELPAGEKKSNSLLPKTFVLIGEIDNMIDLKDHKDFLAVDSSCIGMKIRNTGHYDILRFDKLEDIGRLRRSKFSQALTKDTKELESEFTALETNLEVDRVIFLRHGIRDHGHWTQTFREGIKSYVGKVILETSAYRRLSVLNLLLRIGRRRMVRNFMDEYTEIAAKYPNARNKMGFIGHSHGTLLLARALEEYSEARFDHVAVTGSIIRRDFDWRRIIDSKQVLRIRNDIASYDWTVGIFGGFFEWIKWASIGSAGFNGFEQAEGQNDATMYIKGGHSAALQDTNVSSLLAFIVHGQSSCDYKAAHPAWAEVHVKDQNKFTIFFSNNSWLPIVLTLTLVGVSLFSHICLVAALAYQSRCHLQ